MLRVQFVKNSDNNVWMKRCEYFGWTDDLHVNLNGKGASYDR